MLTWYELLSQQKEWSDRNFGANRPPHWPLLGLMEEVGEYAHAQLKMEQGIRGTVDEHLAAQRDAVADIVIFFCDAINTQGIPPQAVFGPEVPIEEFAARHYMPGVTVFRVLPFLTKICTGEVPDVIDYRNFLVYVIGLLGDPTGSIFAELVESTWARVRARDWKKDSKTGGESAG